MAPISKLDEIIFELNENLKAIMVMEAPKYLKKHGRQKDYVLNYLLEHNFNLLGEDGRKNPQVFRSW